MTASLLPRNIFRLSGTLLHPNVNRRLCSTGDGGNKKDDNTKLLDFLSKQKKIHKKPVELKAKPVKRNISKKDSSSSSSSDSDEELRYSSSHVFTYFESTIHELFSVLFFYEVENGDTICSPSLKQMTCSWHRKTNSPILEFKVLPNVFKIKKSRLKMFFKVMNQNQYTIKKGFKRLSGFYATL